MSHRRIILCHGRFGHTTNKTDHIQRGSACFALCPLALPHDVTTGDVIRRGQKREKRPRPKRNARVQEWAFVLGRTQQRSAGPLFFNNTQQQNTVDTTAKFAGLISTQTGKN